MSKKFEDWDFSQCDEYFKPPPRDLILEELLNDPTTFVFDLDETIDIAQLGPGYKVYKQLVIFSHKEAARAIEIEKANTIIREYNETCNMIDHDEDVNHLIVNSTTDVPLWDVFDESFASNAINIPDGFTINENNIFPNCEDDSLARRPRLLACTNCHTLNAEKSSVNQLYVQPNSVCKCMALTTHYDHFSISDCWIAHQTGFRITGVVKAMDYECDNAIKLEITRQISYFENPHCDRTGECYYVCSSDKDHGWEVGGSFITGEDDTSSEEDVMSDEDVTPVRRPREPVKGMAKINSIVDDNPFFIPIDNERENLIIDKHIVHFIPTVRVFSDDVIIEKHYNNSVSRHIDNQTAVVQLRKYNNFIKATVLVWYGVEGGHGMDVACGKGGDLMKWYRVGMKSLVMVDINRTLLEEAKRRHVESGNKLNVRFFQQDMCQRGIERAGFDDKFDIVVCHFAAHYGCKTENACDAMLHNLTQNLKKGGKLILSFVDSDRLMSMFSEYFGRGNKCSDKKVHRGTLISEKRPVKIGMEYEDILNYMNGFREFGIKYTFSLSTMFTDVPEYLFPKDIVMHKLKVLGLSVVKDINFLDVIDDVMFDKNLAKKMGVIVGDKVDLGYVQRQGVALYKLVILHKD